MQKSFNNTLFDDNILDKQTQTDESLYLELETCNLGLNDVEADTISQVTLLCYWIRQNRKLEGKGGWLKLRVALLEMVYTGIHTSWLSSFPYQNNKQNIHPLAILKFMKSNYFIRQVWWSLISNQQFPWIVLSSLQLSAMDKSTKQFWKSILQMRFYQT